MRRRSFLAGAAAAGAMPLITWETQAQTRDIDQKISAVELWQVTGDLKQYEDYLEEEYPRGGMVMSNFRRPRNAPSRVFMKIATDGGLEGFYGPHDTNVVNEILKIRSVVGMDPLAIDSVWESLVTGNNRYTGPYMFAVSAITNTLWDLKAKFCGLPVYKLLGGSRKVLDCYATCIGMPIDTQDNIAEGAARVKSVGFKGQKWFPTQGPREGAAGLEYNVNMMRTLREVCGNTDDIMIDGLTRWDLSFGMAWCKAVEKYRPRWLEEPFQTYLQLEPLARLREMTSIPIATGEHNYGRRDAYDLMKAGAVDVLQIDPEWGGGITELVKICHLASVYNLIVCPHNQRSTALAHLVASQPESVCPFMEYQIDLQPNLYYFDKNQLFPKNSKITLPDLPGLGVELDEDRIVSLEKIS
ncbi:enolase C-terminal domain-like protein [Candidatus Latescibacterota bacterium]